MGSRIFKFSEPFLKVQSLEDVKDYRVNGKTTLLNVDDMSGITIADELLKPRSSSIFANLVVPRTRQHYSRTGFSISKVIPVRTCDQDEVESRLRYYFASTFEGYQIMALRKREDQQNAEFNLWFADAGTECGLHNEHPFREVHTQVLGIGRMQKFHRNDRTSIYQVFMSPGYTHEPFCFDDGTYPWHQYYADSDCVWLAAEFQ